MSSKFEFDFEMLTERELQIKISSALFITNTYKWLLNSYITDFFIDDHWNKLPECWRVIFENIDITELGRILSGEVSNIILPLSFLSLLSATKFLALSRKPINNLPNNLLNVNIIDNDVSDYSLFNNILKTNSNDKITTLNNIILKRIKKKKRHEIYLMSKLIKKVACITNIKSVVDIGSGLGHLIRILSFKYSLKTIGVEGQTELVTEANKINDHFKQTVNKYITNFDSVNQLYPQHINLFLTPDNKSSLIKKINNMDRPINKEFGIVGLHTCGNLGPLLLKLFVENSQSKFICIAGCCYMKLTDNNENQCYPLSKFVSDTPKNLLSCESRELACHAIENYSDRLKKGLYEDLQIHCYRALLEKIIVSKWNHMKHCGMKSVKHYKTLSFESYCNIALQKFNIVLSEEDLNIKDNQENLKKWKQVVIFYTLRLILAPLVESIILMDRMLYLKENGIICDIIPLFDPLISPRNHVLIARKY